MARPIRIEYEGASYHVMARGNERRKVFHDPEDAELILRTLGEAGQQFGLVLRAYCLMPNHYHLLISTPNGNLSRGIGWLQTAFTIRYNRRHHRSGHLFQGRFKAVLIEADAYAQVLIPYLHLNPVRSRKGGVLRLVGNQKEMEAWPWSSHRFYAGGKGKPNWLNLEWLQYWHRHQKAANRLYLKSIRREFAGGSEPLDPWIDMKFGLVLGAKDLCQKVQERLQNKNGSEEDRLRGQLAQDSLTQGVAALIETERDQRLHLWIRARLGGERKVDLAREYGLKTGAAVLERIKRLEKRAEKDLALKEKMENARNALRIES